MGSLIVTSNYRDRFAGWPRWPAILVLAAFAALLAAAALTADASSAEERAQPASSAVIKDEVQDDDLRLYERIADRVGAGDNYYRTAFEEQRARNFPVTPGLAVRLPTLAYISSGLGKTGMLVAAAVVGLAVIAAWWSRLGAEPGGLDRRIVATLLLIVGSVLALKPQYLALHEVWAGMLLALSFGLHRRNQWLASLIPAALALAIREHALPFILLMAAFAGWRQRWFEMAAWSALVVVFAVGLTAHLAQTSLYILESDRESPPWLVYRGIRGWTSNLVTSSILHLLPPQIAAPLALLPLLGWAGWRSDAGAFGALLHAGYGVFFMMAGRDNNFYWALVVIPTWFMGLAFLPRAASSLWTSALGKS